MNRPPAQRTYQCPSGFTFTDVAARAILKEFQVYSRNELKHRRVWRKHLVCTDAEMIAEVTALITALGIVRTRQIVQVSNGVIVSCQPALFADAVREVKRHGFREEFRMHDIYGWSQLSGSLSRIIYLLGCRVDIYPGYHRDEEVIAG